MNTGLNEGNNYDKNLNDNQHVLCARVFSVIR